jgi:hypothetical protein
LVVHRTAIIETLSDIQVYVEDLLSALTEPQHEPDSEPDDGERGNDADVTATVDRVMGSLTGTCQPPRVTTTPDDHRVNARLRFSVTVGTTHAA